MDFLKKLFPLSFGIDEKQTNQLVKAIVIYVVVSIVLGAVFGWLSTIKLIGLVFSLLGSLIGAYCTAGIVLAILKFCNVLK